MLLTLPPQNFHIVAVFLLFLDKNEKLVFCLQLVLTKKDVQESKVRGGKLFRSHNCQNKGFVYIYVCMEEKVSK